MRRLRQLALRPVFFPTPELRGAGLCLRLTGRGWVVAVVGAVLGVGGWLFDVPDVTALGGAGLAAVVTAAGLTYVTVRRDSRPGVITVRRTVHPHPIVRGSAAAVTLDVSSARPRVAAALALGSLAVLEPAAYTITPPVRGRIALGPAQATRMDLLGMVRVTCLIGDATPVTVWPLHRPVPTAHLAGVYEAPTEVASPLRLREGGVDDVVLRDYVPGDDPRRVHWPTFARRGSLMVRSEDDGSRAADLAPVTVFVDPALLASSGGIGGASARSGGSARNSGSKARNSIGGKQGGTGAEEQWVMDDAASLACSFAQAGHPTRLTDSLERGTHTRSVTELLDTAAMLGHSHLPMLTGPRHDPITITVDTPLNLGTAA
ncbi:MAG: DUF58 domain-containing protein [Cellulomonadaceae bacterium]|nr:DUF58 domain-containing protein [Cellulomonadaceae bacterium]